MKIKNKKSGARHSAGDQEHIQQAHDHLMNAGATCALAKTARPTDQSKMLAAVKAMSDAPNLRGMDARACWNCAFYQAVEGTWDDGRCARFDFQTESNWMCDAWQVLPPAPLLVTLTNSNEVSVDSAGDDTAQLDATAQDGSLVSTGYAPDNAPVAKRAPALVLPAYVKSLHLPYAEQFLKDVVAVKSMGSDDIRGYSNLWGDEQRVDVEQEFFNKRTDFWDRVLGAPRPLTWDHAQDQDTKAAPIIGKALEFGDDDVGRWYHAQLDRGTKYRAAIDALISNRELGTSSDSAPQYVERERTKSGAVWLKTWPLFAMALTTTPAEYRMFDTVHYKTLGIDLATLRPQDTHPARQGDTSESDLAELELVRLAL